MSARAYTLAELAERFDARVEGDAQVAVQRVATLGGAGAGDIAFLANPKYKAEAAATQAAAVILAPGHVGLTTRPRLVHANPYACFARVAAFLNPHAPQAQGIDAHASVSASARIGKHASIGAFVAIGDDVEIGENALIYPNVTIYPRVRIGKNVIIHAGAVIGADGFGIAPDEGRWLKIPQTGTVVIGDDVEIGANTTIDRGAIENTVIGQGVKLDNQIQIGHNVIIGDHTVMAGCVGIAGSATIGAHCQFGGSSSVLGHLTVADHVAVTANTMITRSILKSGTYTGSFPYSANADWLKNAAHLRSLDAMHERIRTLERRLSALDKS
jgi:UDP-3-O-[3-hydroxymyristoyl] glucosamine N-acyltransferase